MQRIFGVSHTRNDHRMDYRMDHFTVVMLTAFEVDLGSSSTSPAVGEPSVPVEIVVVDPEMRQLVKYLLWHVGITCRKIKIWKVCIACYHPTSAVLVSGFAHQVLPNHL